VNRRCFAALLALLLLLLAAPALLAQEGEPAAAPPVPPRVEPPAASATARELETRGDELRAQKLYLDALDYYRAALRKSPTPVLHNKIGLTEMQLMHLKEAKKSFERAIKADRKYADGYNNLGVIHYLKRKYGKAIKQYRKAIALRENSPTYHLNLGSAYFSKRDFERARAEYTLALQLDPDIFEHRSQVGVTAQMSSPGDRAHYSFLIARMYAGAGDLERSLLYLRRAMEEGYEKIDDVYKDEEFTALRKDPRFAELMASRPAAIPQ
jgi:tetratricopeptide (TPR) repeat protein